MAKKNGKNLVIVESPAKAKTINKYLGDDYIVKASMGHVRDLPSKGMGVDLKTFIPEYEVLASRGKVISELRKLAKNAGDIYLATDLDREGEAIAWHLKEALGIPDDRVKRVIFNAITKSEIQKAFAKPHKIDIDRVNAQQARRILDRIVGYEISPLLWRKVARGLSAGRVQSVAVRLVVERERQIEAFVPEEYWKIAGVFTSAAEPNACKALSDKWHDFLTNTGNGERTKAEREKWLAEHKAFAAELVELGGKKFGSNNKADALRAAQLLGFLLDRDETTDDADAKGPARHVTRLYGRPGACPTFNIRSIEKKRVTSRPGAPFITSTLQQAGASRLGFGAQRTMRVAQTLYEAGHITYMRTDSTNLSGDAVGMARGFIEKQFGPRYLPEKANVYASSNKSAQEAHEAVRPTDVTFDPSAAHAKLSTDEHKLYQLIWNRFVACQMSPAEFDQTTVTIAGGTKDGDVVFRASGRKLVFDGFMRVSGITSEDQLLPDLREQQPVSPIEIDPTQHFTQAPPRFTEASLVKELERLGIGRPSTYASIIQTIQDREYVEQVDRRFYATMLGSIVTVKLVQAFPEIMDVGFTAGMELKLDSIEEQHLDWIKLLQDFYGPFHAVVDGALEKIEHAGGTASPYKCDKCQRPMVYRISKNGFFLSCSGYPDCDGTKPVDKQGKPTIREVSEHKCPVCGREMIKRRGRFGEFLGCSGYSVKNEKGEPSCSTIINLDKEGNPLPPKPKPIKTTIKCEKCGSDMLLRDSKRGPFLGCSSFPKCRSTKMMKKLEGANLQQIEALLPLLKDEAAKSQEMIAKIIGANPAAAGNGQTIPSNVPTDIDCDECGKPMLIRKGRRGPFLGCSGYPKCKNTSEVPAKLLEEMGLNGNGAAKVDEKKPVKKGAKVKHDDEIETDLTVD
ncbi:MAG: type I DNA topoisomerase [Tepidisphaeraceae bacterium]